jgi:hypothetical protein
MPRLRSTGKVPRCALKSVRGIAAVCLGADAGARHGVKTGENAALLNRR